VGDFKLLDRRPSAAPDAGSAAGDDDGDNLPF